VCLLRPALEKKAEWLQRYLKALPEWLPEETKMLTQDQMRALASSIMDANMFAGGQVASRALPLWLSHGLASSRAPSHLELSTLCRAYHLSSPSA